MKTPITRAAMIALTACALTLLPLRAQAASSLPLGTTLYPAHAQLAGIPDLSNSQMDCDWGFVCQNGQPRTNQPLFHFTTEDALHRVAGWAQFGQVQTKHGKMLFALYASHYADGQDADGLPWNLRAFVDFRLTTLAHGFTELNHDPVLVPRGILGNSGAQIARGPTQDVLALACWTGSTEVEAVAIYVHGDRGARATALRDLISQVRSAILTIQRPSVRGPGHEVGRAAPWLTRFTVRNGQIVNLIWIPS